MTRWLIRPEPLIDELFSSWLHRCALANYLNDHTFCRAMFGSIPIWNRDADRAFPSYLIPRLTRYLGTEKTTIRKTLLTSYAGVISKRINIYGTTPHITHVGVYHRDRRAHGQQYCAECLKQWPYYFKKQWRLSFITVCPEHGVILQDACPKCDAPIALQRLFVSKVFGVRCNYCNGLLCDTKKVAADESITLWTENVLESLQSGSSYLNHKKLSTMTFLRGIRILAAALISKKFSGLSFPANGYPRIEGRGRHTFQFERQRLALRYQIMKKIVAWLDDWPSALRSDIEQYGIMPSLLVSDVAAPPRWILQGTQQRRHKSR